jgi:ketosteroid isomerase-like protein
MATSNKNDCSAATKPEDIQRLFAEAINSGNVDALLALYESDATLVVPPS